MDICGLKAPFLWFITPIVLIYICAGGVKEKQRLEILVILYRPPKTVVLNMKSEMHAIEVHLLWRILIYI